MQETLTAKLKSLHMEATGILSRREAIVQLINESEMPQSKDILKLRLRGITESYANTMEKLMNTMQADKVGNEQFEFGIDPELLQNCIQCTL